MHYILTSKKMPVLISLDLHTKNPRFCDATVEDELEDGLVLVQKEMKIENPDGADGSIDIFAADRWNHKVVIEIKRSDQTARQALHEILKYTELLRRHGGLRDSQLRVIIVSTVWHELLVPFSACIK